MATNTLLQVKTKFARFLGQHWGSTATTQAVQTVAISGSPTGGHYHLIWNALTSGEIAFDAAASAVQTALRAMLGLENVTVTATGSTPNFTNTIYFKGVSAAGSAVTADATALTGGTPVITITGGTATRLTDATLIDMDSSQFPYPAKGAYVRMTSGNASGDIRRIVTDPDSAGTIEPNRPFTGAVVYGDTYEVLGNSVYPGQQLTDMFNDVLSAARPLTETNLAIVTSQRFYDVTPYIRDRDDVRRVYLRGIDSNYLEPYHRQHFGRFDVARHLTSVQTVAVSGTPTSGNYTLTYGSLTTAAIAYNAAATAVQAALRLLSGLGSITVSATGTTPNFTNTVTFIGVTGTAQTLTATDSTTGGTHAVTVATGTGIPAWWLELPTTFTSQSPVVEEIWMSHYATLASFTDDTSTVQDIYADWLAWEAVLRHAVDMSTTSKSDRANWGTLAKVAMGQVLSYRDSLAPYVPRYVRTESVV